MRAADGSARMTGIVKAAWQQAMPPFLMRFSLRLQSSVSAQA
jgi:hypothetical protein